VNRAFHAEVENTILLTVEEVAIRLRVKRSWIYGHAEALGALRLGKYLRFSWPIVLERLEGKIQAFWAGPPARRPGVRRVGAVPALKK
jgi:hypothetical protein